MRSAPRASSRFASSAPSAAASAGAPVSSSRSISDASGRPTRPRRPQRPSASVAWPATGVRQPTPRPGEQRALGGDRHLGGCDRRARGTARRRARRRARLERQRALPDRRQHADVGEPLGDARREAEPIEPAQASTPASTTPSATLRSRVSTLPRRISTRRSARAARTWQTRRKLEVPMRLPAGSAPSAAPARLTIASRGSARVGDRRRAPGPAPARRARPSGCARRDRSRRRAAPSSISLTQTPLPPSSITGPVCTRSPCGDDDLLARPRGPGARRAAARPTCAACQRASALPRVPMTIASRRPLSSWGSSCLSRLAARARRLVGLGVRHGRDRRGRTAAARACDQRHRLAGVVLLAAPSCGRCSSFFASALRHATARLRVPSRRRRRITPRQPRRARCRGSAPAAPSPSGPSCAAPPALEEARQLLPRRWPRPRRPPPRARRGARCACFCRSSMSAR